MKKLLVAIVFCTTAMCGMAAEERADFATGVGTNGWTISVNEYTSPLYVNSVKSVRLEYHGESAIDDLAVYATHAQGGETQIATLNGASSAATIELSDTMDFRLFRIAVGAGMNLSSFTASIQASQDAFPLSELSGNKYSQDFDSLAAITSSTGDKDWSNGVTLPYWQAWIAADEVTKFTYNGGKSNVAGMYALANDRNDPGRAFGAFSKRDVAMTWGIAFVNDTDWTVRLSSIAYSAQQWGFANTSNHSLVCSYLVTNSLDWIVNFANGWVACSETAALLKDSTHETPTVTPVNYTPSEQVRIPVGSVLILKWTLAQPISGFSSMMAIDDLTVTFEDMPYPLLIRLADVGSP